MTVNDTVNGGDDYDVLNFTDSNGLNNDLNNVTNIFQSIDRIDCNRIHLISICF